MVGCWQEPFGIGDQGHRMAVDIVVVEATLLPQTVSFFSHFEHHNS